MARAAAYDEDLAERRKAEKERLDRIELAEASERIREFRRRAWVDFVTMADLLARKLAAGDALSPKDVRELVLARERAGITGEKAFHGLDALLADQAGDHPDAEVAAEITAVLARAALKRLGKG